MKFVKGYLDLDMVAKDKGINTYSVSTTVVQKCEGKTEHFAIRTQAQWGDWVNKLDTGELSLLCKKPILWVG